MNSLTQNLSTQKIPTVIFHPNHSASSQTWSPHHQVLKLHCYQQNKLPVREAVAIFFGYWKSSFSNFTRQWVQKPRSSKSKRSEFTVNRPGHKCLPLLPSATKSCFKQWLSSKNYRNNYENPEKHLILQTNREKLRTAKRTKTNFRNVWMTAGRNSRERECDNQNLTILKAATQPSLLSVVW